MFVSSQSANFGFLILGRMIDFEFKDDRLIRCLEMIDFVCVMLFKTDIECAAPAVCDFVMSSRRVRDV